MPQDLFDRLFRTTVGFGDLANFVNHIDIGTYPPYNIEKVKDHPIYAITIAVAGFQRDELEVTLKDSLLTVKGNKNAQEQKTEMIHQGLAFRNFKREWQLNRSVDVTNVSLKDGLLVVMIQENTADDSTKKFDIN